MPEILLLDNSTIDKIAAGEVVERPASVVKELVENAVDSGAGAVTVEIKEGGISFIRVTDNGCGIEKKQVKQAFLRHATSKIRSVEDLLYVSSLGFRGEALSSIAAVSQTEMITKTAKSLTGIRYVIEGSVEKETEEIGAPQGTTILVRNLFYNTPARRKFLRTPQTEGSYVSDLMEHLAMSMPRISFKYVYNGQVKFHTSGNGDLKEIIYRIYGREITGKLVHVKREQDGMRLEGYLGKPSINRANRNFEHYFVNGRYIKSTVISKAAEEGYRPYLMQHKYPFFVLHFRLEQDMLDVNVHPAKMEIRFTGQTAFYNFVSDAVRAALSEKEMIKEVTLENTPRTQDIVPQKLTAPEPFETVRIKQGILEEPPVYGEKSPKMQEVLQNPPRNKVLGNGNHQNTPQNENIHANIIKNSEHILVEKPVQMNLFDEKILTKESKSEYNILGQVFDTYWIVVFRDKLLFIDQHAAHEKVKYEHLMKKLRESTPVSQNLNPPIIVSLSGREEASYLEYAGHFRDLGFEIEAFGGNEYAIRSVPSDLFGCNEKQLFEEIMDELAEGPVKGTPAVIVEKIASMSCKAAVKGNNALSRAEAERLIDDLLELENPYHCPHGRPTIITMSKYEMEKKFSRIVT